MCREHGVGQELADDIATTLSNGVGEPVIIFRVKTVSYSSVCICT